MLWAVQLVHATYVAFVITAPALVLSAGLAGARWSLPLRWAHGLTIVFIAVQYALDWPCPLTMLENVLTGRPLDTELLAGLSGHGAALAGVVAVYLVVSVMAYSVAWRRPVPA